MSENSQHDPKQSIVAFPSLRLWKVITVYTVLSTIAFVGVYGWCNQAAAQATTHYHLYTEWELGLPLIPWMIFPYVSLNLLFAISPFILKTEESVKGFCLSLMGGALIAGLFFFLFPGKLGFVRVDVPGYEAMFQFMFSIDHPHNLFPSLHVTYSTLAIMAMKDQTKSLPFHFFLYLWLFMVTISVVLVHQHHLFDVMTGAILAGILYRLVYRRYCYS